MGMTRSSNDGGLQLPDPETPLVIWQDGVCRTATDLSGIAIFPGAFNPIHDGHRQLRQAAAEFLGCPVLFELSVCNAEKRSLTAAEVSRRLRQISDSRVLLTNAALFVDKASLFPGCWFVVGFDTAERILDPKYYDENMPRRDQSLRESNDAQTRRTAGVM